MAGKRESEDTPDDEEASGLPRKLQKTAKAGSIADTAERYSEEMRKKIGRSGRTGQACDRCRIRKLKCDSSVPNCSSCTQSELDCFTTDRFSGETYTRGYVRQLETRVQALEEANKELSLQSAAHDAGPATLQSKGRRPACSVNHQDAPADAIRRLRNDKMHSIIEDPETKLPPFRAEELGDNYLGRSSGTSLLSCIRGTSLSVLDTELDYADMLIVEEDDPKLPAEFDKSYEACFKRMMRIYAPMNKLDLPPREIGMQLAVFYFAAIHPFMPLLHRPSFMILVRSRYTCADTHTDQNGVAA